jgi:hypothetical protein
LRVPILSWSSVWALDWWFKLTLPWLISTSLPSTPEAELRPLLVENADASASPLLTAELMADSSMGNKAIPIVDEAMEGNIGLEPLGGPFGSVAL